MIGHQEYQPKLFSTVDIEAFIPPNHLLRKIDKILDFSFVREMTEHLYCANNGRPSVDPVLFFRIYLIIFLYGIESDRQACDEIQYNLAYRWFCRLALEDSVPDHSSLSKIRDRLGEDTFKKIFERLINVCLERKLLKGSKVMMDGSFIKADAALDSLVPRDGAIVDPAEEAKKYIKGKKFSNETHVSKTDPDCNLAGKVHEKKELRYKVHETIDRESRIILDPHVTAGSEVDGKQMLSRIDHIEETFNVTVKEFTGDRGYGYGENLQALEDRKIKSFVPRFRTDSGTRMGRDSVGFKFNKKQDFFICPKGHKLTPMGPDPLGYKRYRIKGGHCKTCPLRESCLNMTAMKTRNTKHIDVHPYQRVIDKAAKLETTDEFMKMRGERQWKMEGIFAEGKAYHGLGHARYRGRSKMQIQAYMIAFVQNVKRLVSLTPWLKSFYEKLITSFIKPFFVENYSEFLSARI